VNREMRPPSKPLMSDAEFRTFLDAVGCLVQPQQFRLAVYQSGVEPSLRKVVWRHLLNIYPDSLTGRERFDYLRRKSNEYFRLRNEWQVPQFIIYCMSDEQLFVCPSGVPASPAKLEKSWILIDQGKSGKIL